MQKIEIITPHGTETRHVLDPSTLIRLSKLDTWERTGNPREDGSKIWLVLHRHFLKYPDFEFESLIENQKAFLHRLAADYTDFWNDLKLDFKELSPSVFMALHSHGLHSLHIENYNGEPIPRDFMVLRYAKSLTISGEYGLDASRSQFNLEPILFARFEYLKLENLGITEIDSRIVRLKRLKVLSLDDNPLKSLPDFLFEIPSRPLLLLRGTQVPEAELEARAKEYPHMQISY